MAGSPSDKHPDYLDREDEWTLMRDAVRGESAVKGQGETYLPKPSGFTSQPDKGEAFYAAYQKRARFPEIVNPAVQAMVGVIHQAEIQIELPERMNWIWERATVDGLPLEAFHRRVTGQILEVGRYAILADAPEGGNPYLAGYSAESLINWDEARQLYVLDESGLVRDGFGWTHQEQFLALELIDGRYTATRYNAAGQALDKVAQPTTARREALTEIPLVVAGPRDLSLKTETPPLIGIARPAVSMYQLSADYRWQLFMSGQETLVVINGEAPDAVGAGACVSLQGGEGVTPDMKYVGPSGIGIAAHKTAIEDEKADAANAGARLFNSGDKSAESGDALRIRFTAETASLVSIAHASCAALERSLRDAALLHGLSATEAKGITVTPPTSLVDRKMSPEEMGSIMNLWDKGLISGETAYTNLQDGGVASPDRSWDDEIKLIEEGGNIRLPSMDESGALT